MTDFKEVKADLIIKLGGSVITVKDKLETIDDEALETAGKLIQSVQRENLKCIICHGAGSFGHIHAKQYGVNSGFSGLNQGEAVKVRDGFCITRLSVTKLQRLVVEKLVSIGVPAVALSPCGGWKTDNGKVIQHSVKEICDLLYSGFIPVIHGDCVLDVYKGCNILSGDTIIKTLCTELKVKRVVFLSDVNGIYDRPPLDHGAQHLPDIFINSDGSFCKKIDTECRMCDVTGGIQLKLNTARDIIFCTKGETDVFICHLNSKVAEQLCCHGNNITEKTDSFTKVSLLEKDMNCI